MSHCFITYNRSFFISWSYILFIPNFIIFFIVECRDIEQFLLFFLLNLKTQKFITSFLCLLLCQLEFFPKHILFNSFEFCILMVFLLIISLVHDVKLSASEVFVAPHGGQPLPRANALIRFYLNFNINFFESVWGYIRWQI